MNGIFAITALDLRMAEGGWGFAEQHRQEIAQHWQEIVAGKPTLWNGEVLVCRDAAVENGVLSARFMRTDYASFVAWRDWGRPDGSVWSCFGVPAVLSADGFLLIGVMGPWTLNAGRAYPPSGSLEPRDVNGDGVVDLLGSMRTELREETGLDLAEAVAGNMIAVFDGPRIAVARRHDFAQRFAELSERFERHRGSEEHPELEAVEGFRSASQIDSRVPVYAAHIIRYFLS